MNSRPADDGSNTRSTVAVLIAIAAYLFVSYGHALTLPFLNDDYVFLDKIRDCSFWDLWKPERLAFDWYRPWSRELHFWALHHVAGLHEPAYHLASFALWLLIIALFLLLVRRFASTRIAVIATCCLATLTLWSAPLLWVAGAQDLWMLVFSLLFLHAVLPGWRLAAVAALVLALLSKESAAVLPGIATAYFWIVERRNPWKAVRATALLWGVVLTWAILHPTLTDRFFGPLQHSIEAETRPAPIATVGGTLLAQLNLDDRPSIDSGWMAALWRGGLGAALLGLAVWFALRNHRGMLRNEHSHRILLFGAIWALFGWLILLLPSIGWHAYYGVMGSLGIWIVLGVLLEKHARTAIVLVFALALLREARAATPSWDWGTYWYQKRAGALLGSIRERLRGFYPTLPPHSRLFFAHVPNNIGFLAGDGPAVRVWYRDPTLQARYYSEYALRSPQDSLGEDFFFRFDESRALVQVIAGPESLAHALGRNPAWRRDHVVLASLFMRAGNVAGAADEYAKLSSLDPSRAEFALFAATAYQAIGDSLAARRHYQIAGERMDVTLIQSQAPKLVQQAREFRARGVASAR